MRRIRTGGELLVLMDGKSTVSGAALAQRFSRTARDSDQSLRRRRSRRISSLGPSPQACIGNARSANHRREQAGRRYRDRRALCCARQARRLYVVHWGFAVAYRDTGARERREIRRNQRFRDGGARCERAECSRCSREQPWKDVKELVEAAKVAGGSMTFASVGVGSLPQFLGLLLQQQTGREAYACALWRGCAGRRRFARRKC
jgi:hypothetical protein